MSAPPWLREGDGGVLLDVLVQPRASRTRVVGEHDGRLKLQLAAPPVDGEANDELVRHLADLFGVPRRAVTLRSGDTSRRKTVHVAGASAATAAGLLASKSP